MSQPITMERAGQRVYVAGNTFALKDRLKSIGCHWDGDRRQWWIGAAKTAALESLLTAAAEQPAPAEDLDRARVHAKVRYKDRTYYALAQNQEGTRVRLVTLDGAVDFWADTALCRTERTYPPREYRGRTEYTTLGSLRRFVAQQKNPATRRGECTECGAWGPSGESCPECGGEGSYV